MSKKIIFGLIVLVTLLFLINACANLTIPEQITTPSQEIEEKPKQPEITEEETEEDKKEQETPVKESEPSQEIKEFSDEEICVSVGGSWFSFSNTCVDSCTKARSKESVLCGQAFTWGCECGPNKCWNGKTCELTIKEESLPPDNETIQDNVPIECSDFLDNEHVMFGYPSNERILERQAYVISHDDNKKVATWVSYHLTAEYLKVNAIRSNKFKADPDIPKGNRAELVDYKGSGYDRGHIAPSADMLRSQSINDESFLLSNMAPQAALFNRGIWKNLESLIRDWAEKRKSIWIISGPIFDTGYLTIGTNQVGVPQRFYKIVISGEDCDFDTIAFIFSNEKGENPLADYITSIDEIESKTGLNFLDVIEDTLEDEIEATSAEGLWDN